jgi:N-sulfoglucosamine sulfohydrolase
LSLAGVDLPGDVDGKAFLGVAAVEPRKTLVFTRDRMDERCDFIRVVRDERYRYTRNFLPQVPAFPWLTYMEKLESSKAFRRLQTSGNTGQFTDFLGATKAAEELYDLEADPDEFTNLANDPAHRETLERLRDELADWMLATRDSGFLPEQQLMAAETSAGSIREFCADESRYPLRQLLAEELSLDDKNAAVRFHAALRSTDNASLAKRLKVEPDSDVRVALAWSLGDVTALSEAIESDQPWSRVLALNALDYLGEAARPALPLLQQHETQKETRENPHDCWLAQRIIKRF